jgi:hypothetical protein
MYGLLDCKFRSVDQNGSRNLNQRGFTTLAITTIPGFQLLGKAGKVNIHPLLFQLPVATLRTYFYTGGQEDFISCISEYHAAHIAPVGYQSGHLSEVPLFL